MAELRDRHPKALRTFVQETFKLGRYLVKHRLPSMRFVISGYSHAGGGGGGVCGVVFVTEQVRPIFLRFAQFS